jgi:hypothetical protein
MLENPNVFDPVLCSNADNLFLLDHLGEPTVVAMRSLQPPATPATVRPILDRINELQSLEKADGEKWVGVNACKQAIKTWMAQNAKWAHDYKTKRNAPRWPSLYSYDAQGRPHRSGPGSDSGRVRTHFGPNGERIPFAVNLVPDVQTPWEGPISTEQPLSSGLKVDAETHRIECLVKLDNGSICGHTESYKDSSRSSYNAARARMSKHLRKTTENMDGHRAVHTLEFGGADVQ